MRRHILRSLLLGSFIFGLVNITTVAHADDCTVRKAIQMQYDKWSIAYVENDVPTLLAILTPDFTLRTGSGKVLTREQYEAILNKRKPKTPEQMRYSLVIERFKVKGNTATLYTRETQSETTVDAKPHIHEYLDRWIKSSHSWRLQYSETLKETH